MARKAILPDGLFDSRRLDYTQAIVEDGSYYVSGQVAMDEDGELVGDDTETQARRAFENVGLILAELGKDFGDVAKVTSYLTDMEGGYDGFKAAYGDVFDEEPYPAHTMLGVEALATPEILVEIEVELPAEG